MLEYSKKTLLILILAVAIIWIMYIGLRWSYKNAESNSAIRANEKTELVISADRADMIIERGSGNEIIINGKRIKSIDDNANGNIYEVKAKTSGIFGSEKGILRITLPENAIKSLSLKTATGDISIIRTELDELYIDVVTGNVEGANINAKRKIQINSTTGDVELIDSMTDEINVKLTTGDFEAIGISAKTLNLKSTTGDSYIVPEYLEKLDANVTTGDIELELKEEPKAISWSTGRGELSINDEEFKGDFIGKGILEIYARTSNGDLEIKY